jgi:hypothetical protein
MLVMKCAAMIARKMPPSDMASALDMRNVLARSMAQLPPGIEASMNRFIKPDNTSTCSSVRPISSWVAVDLQELKPKK